MSLLELHFGVVCLVYLFKGFKAIFLLGSIKDFCLNKRIVANLHNLNSFRFLSFVLLAMRVLFFGKKSFV